MAEKLELHYRNLLAPGVRIALLADDASPEERERALLEQLRRDLISLEITRHASGPGEYKLTLANWDPNKLRHRYNDFAVIRFGNRLRIDLRYWPDPQVDVRNPDAATDGWVPMIAGPITELQFTFGSEGSRISVTGEDDMRPLKDNVEKKLTYKANEAKIIGDTLAARHYPLELKIASLPARLSFLTDEKPQNRINEAHEKGQSYLEYIQKFVDKYDLELYLSFEGVDQQAWFSSRQIKQVLNLGPSRATAGPRDRVLVLRYRHELIELNPTIKVADQFTSVRVRGRSRFRDDPNGIDGFVDGNDVATEVKNYQQKPTQQKPGPPKLVTAPEIRQKFFGKNDSDSKEKTNLDKHRAEAAACATMMRKARELVVVQGSTVGLPQLGPGQYVQIEAVDDLFDGIYYVSSTTHSYGSDGMKTRFTAQRAGMPLPDDKTGVAA